MVRAQAHHGGPAMTRPHGWLTAYGPPEPEGVRADCPACGVSSGSTHASPCPFLFRLTYTRAELEAPASSSSSASTSASSSSSSRDARPWCIALDGGPVVVVEAMHGWRWTDRPWGDERVKRFETKRAGEVWLETLRLQGFTMRGAVVVERPEPPPASSSSSSPGGSPVVGLLAEVLFAAALVYIKFAGELRASVPSRAVATGPARRRPSTLPALEQAAFKKPPASSRGTVPESGIPGPILDTPPEAGYPLTLRATVARDRQPQKTSAAAFTPRRSGSPGSRPHDHRRERR